MIKTKIRHYFSIPRLLAFGGLVFLVLISTSHPLRAQTVTEAYGSDQQLQRGMIVQLKKSDTTKVEATSINTTSQMHGVVVNVNDAPVALSSEGNKTYVAIVGHYDVLVSNQAGPIGAGDYITISALSGIGMKAGSTDSFVLGKALSTFDGKSNVLSTSDIKSANGKSVTVNITRIQVDISVGHNPLQKANEPNLPSFLKKASQAIAGKEVSARRIYISVIVFVISTIAAAILLYGGIRNGLISIGRNPLSKKAIVRSMMQAILAGIIIFITGLFGVYLLLKL